MKIKYYRYPHPNNVGDTLTPYILEHFAPGVDFKQVMEREEGKLIAVGSIMRVIKQGDVIWGSGVMRETDVFEFAPSCNFLAVRGKMSRDRIMKSGGVVPEVYGDPALLLPLMYQPEDTEKSVEVGIIPHFVDTPLVTKAKALKLGGTEDYKMIDVFLDWKAFVDEVVKCKRVISSSLHGIIIAEAYGIPAEWVVLSDKVIGNGFKFRDHLTGTGREPQGPGKFPELKGETLIQVQRGLIDSLNNFISHNERKT